MGRHHAQMDLALTEVARGNIKRLIIEMPPRHGKSLLCSRYFPAWYHCTYPGSDVILAGAEGDLAKDFSASARDLIQEYGRVYWNTGIHPTKRRSDDWHTTTGGRTRAAGVGGGIMGRGADILLIDDYFKSVEKALSPTERTKLIQWYLTTSQTRLSPTGAVILIATRWHPEDLIGHVLKLEEMGGDKWVRIRLPAFAEENDLLGREPGEALWPDQWSKELLEERRKSYMLSGYPWMWDALYQQRPPTTLDAYWDPALFEGDDIFFESWPDPANLQFKLCALDPSLGKSDKSDLQALIMLAMDNDGIMYVDADIDRRDPWQLIHFCLDTQANFQPKAFGIEAVAFQELLLPICEHLSKERGMMMPTYGIHQPRHSGGKAGRIKVGLTPYLRRRQFRFRRRSPGVNLLLEQLRGFPTHEHDDGPDALEMAVVLARAIHGGEVAVNP